MMKSFLNSSTQFSLQPDGYEKYFIFDIETNGFYNEVTEVFCIVIHDVNRDKIFSYRPDSIANALIHLDEADVLIGHNIIFYDIPVLQKLFPGVIDFQSKDIIDTLVCSRLLWPKEKLYEIDEASFNHIEPRSKGSNSLKAWGQRFKNYKGDFNDFSKFSEEMLTYCVQDTSVTKQIYELLCSKGSSYTQSLDLEHKLARCIERQIRSGFHFDVDAACALVCELEARRDELEKELKEAFPPKDEGDWFVPRVNNKNKGYVAGEKIWREKLVEFNPGSRQQICERLKEKYGWQPENLTDKGNPIVNDEVLENLIYPEAKPLSEYLLVKKRLGQIKEGANAWLKLVTEENIIHGDLITNGCITGRASHCTPNMAQVPASYSPYGKECRSLFVPPDGFHLIGADAKALELRCLAGYLSLYDSGEYGRIVCDEEQDIHTYNQGKFGVATRDISKVLIYASMYGCGNYKAGTIVAPNETDPDKIKAAGRKAIESFMEGVPALAQLKKDLSKNLADRGYLLGLDGRPLFCRSEFKALNVLLQAAGAVLMKQVVIGIHQNLEQAGLIYAVDWHQHGFIHDEVQLSCRPGVTETVIDLTLKAFVQAGEHFNFRVPIEGDAKVGLDWSATH